jgi:hypothetical protein
LEILKKAASVDEILKVQSEVFKVRAEIEALEARKKNWDRDIDFSTITVTARQKQVAIVSKKEGALSGSDFLKSIGKGFKESTSALILFLQNVMIFVISNIITIIILAVLGFFGFKLYKKLYK